MEAKKLFRQIAGLLVFLPVAVKVYALAVFEGKKSAIARCGPAVTAMAKWSLRFWVPEIEKPSDFDLFPTKMKANFNGCRRNLVAAFNRLASLPRTPEQTAALADLRQYVVGLVCMYDPNVQGDCDDLSEQVSIREVPPE